MKNSNEQYALDHFQTVWARVSDPMAETACAPVLSPVETLSFLIAAETESIAHYAALAKRVGGTVGQILAGLVGEERSHLRQLELELFLCSGMLHRHTPAAPHQIKGILTELQTAYAAEQEISRQYQLANAAALQPELRKLYAALAKAETRHANVLRGLISRMLGTSH